MELQYPYGGKLFSNPLISSDSNAQSMYSILSLSLSECHMGTCMFFAGYPDYSGGPVKGHVVYAIGVKRQVNNPYDFKEMTELYLANPQFGRGSDYAINFFKQADVIKWYCHATVYNGRL